MNLTLAVAFNHHDSSVTLADERRVLCVLEAERYFRVKKKTCSRAEMETLIRAALASIGAEEGDIRHVVVATLENAFLQSDDRYTRNLGRRTARVLGKERRVTLVNHHAAHAGLTFAFPSMPTLISSCDGGGDLGERNEYYLSDGTALLKVASRNARAVTAKLYDVVSQYVYGAVRCEGKLMALAAYGTQQQDDLALLRRGRSVLSTGTYAQCFGYLRTHWRSLRGAAAADPMRVANFAAATQHFFEEERLRDLRSVVRRQSGLRRLLLVGGAALNIILNSRIREAFPHLDVLAPPCCDDTGQSLGALLYAHAARTGRRLHVALPFLGLGNAEATMPRATVERIVRALVAGKVIALHHGSAEIGPRALGHRSFIAQATTLRMRHLLNDVIKQREAYRPLAPIVLRSEMRHWFVEAVSSPYMLFAVHSKPVAQKRIPAALHVDGTARVQTVTRVDVPLFPILVAYRNRTGTPVLLNTSLNLRGDPLSNDMEDTRRIVQRFPRHVIGVYNGQVLR